MNERSCHGAPASSPSPSGEPFQMTVALAGNPNVGKSSLFNYLTGSRQHVGNWPGKTVERRMGVCRRGSRPITVIDLPGTYSLASSSPEEIVTEEVIASGAVDAVGVVLDSTNLERSLYLAAQIAELGRPLVLILNMSDLADADGIVIDAESLGEAFAAPVVRTAGRVGAGVDDLVSAIAELETG